MVKRSILNLLKYNLKSQNVNQIGGGEIGRPGYPIETTAIDREIIRLSGKNGQKFFRENIAATKNFLPLNDLLKNKNPRS